MTMNDADLIAEFVVESSDHLSDIENQLLQIEAAGANIDVDLVNTVFRGVHSIKGAAGFLGLIAINELAHHLENVLNLIRNQQLVPTSAIIEVMLRAGDELRRMVIQAADSNGRDISQLVHELDRIAHGQGGHTANPPPPPASEKTPVFSQASPPLEAPSAVVAPVPVEGNSVVSSAPPAPPAETTPAAATATENLATGNGPSTVEGSIRVSVSVLDRLMNLAGELVLSRNQLVQAVGSPQKTNLESVAAGVDRVTSELQEAIMCTRMQPIGNVFSRFPRVLRDLAAKLGKQCELQIEGKEVEVDKTIVEAIGDPLTHLVRNSVDHGIESPEVRVREGKPRAGRIFMKACYQAGKVKIIITDDGAGIDPRKLRDKAVAKGLITSQQAAAMSEREAIHLIFHPGFSTAEKISDVSGRGVGMDVVRTNIERLGGTVDVESEVGRGTTIHITLPLTLAIIPAMIVTCRSQRYAIPQVNIVELVRIKGAERDERICRLKDVEVLRLRGSLLPLVRLDQALAIPDGIAPPQQATDLNFEADDTVQVVVVESGQTRYGLVVETVQDSEEIVVKALGKHLKGCSCLAGATILGDGYVALILDVQGVANLVHLRQTETHDPASGKTEEDLRQSQDRQTLLRFRNTAQEHFAVPMAIVTRIERVRAEQLIFVGGTPVLQYEKSCLPLLDLTTLLHTEPRPELKRYYVIVFAAGGQEIGLVAAQLNDIHNVSLELDQATFRQPGVLGALVIDGVTTRVLNLHELAEAANPEWFADRQRVTAEIVKEQCTILIAEDSTFFRRQLTSMMEGRGYTVLGAEDGQQAWDLLASGQHAIDLVLSDVEMPRLNGLQLCQRIKSTASVQHLPVVMLSSLAGDDDVQRGRQAGADDYQVKLDHDALLNSIVRLLSTRTHTPSRRPSTETAVLATLQA